MPWLRYLLLAVQVLILILLWALDARPVVVWAYLIASLVFIVVLRHENVGKSAA